MDSCVELFIDAAILAGEVYAETRVDHKDDWRGQYQIWAHADRMLNNVSPSEHDLACALFQLNRAVDFRDKVLDGIYAFKEIPNQANKKNKHETMEDLGIIKQLLKTKLDNLRNQLVHRLSEPPPSIDARKELAEFTWY